MGGLHTLAMCLQELAPNRTIFDKLAFLDEVMNELESLGSLYKETQNNCMHLHLASNEMEPSSLQPPLYPWCPSTK
jgi:hypothetical protein